MSAVLHSITDPRGPLEKARRLELFRFAREHGMTEITETMPADLMRAMLRNKGITNISGPDRPLGFPLPSVTTPASHKTGPQAPKQPEKLVEVSAEEDLARQWREEQSRPVVAEMSYGEMQKECKRRGIKMKRTDKIADLKAKLNG